MGVLWQIPHQKPSAAWPKAERYLGFDGQARERGGRSKPTFLGGNETIRCEAPRYGSHANRRCRWPPKPVSRPVPAAGNRGRERTGRARARRDSTTHPPTEAQRLVRSRAGVFPRQPMRRQRTFHGPKAQRGVRLGRARGLMAECRTVVPHRWCSARRCVGRVCRTSWGLSRGASSPWKPVRPPTGGRGSSRRWGIGFASFRRSTSSLS